VPFIIREVKVYVLAAKERLQNVAPRTPGRFWAASDLQKLEVYSQLIWLKFRAMTVLMVMGKVG
jgi:hypothetical protein